MSQPDVATLDGTPAPPATVADSKGEVQKQEELDPDWAFDRILYKGDNLAVRKAKLQALMAYQLSSGKYISMERQNNASGLFIDHHIGPDSYDRIMERMSNPDDPDYTMQSFGEIMGQLVRMSSDAIREETEARKRAALEAEAKKADSATS